jgi:hypothetical protein
MEKGVEIMDNGLFDKEKTYQFEIEKDGPYGLSSIYTGVVLGADSLFVRIRDRDGIERGFRKSRLKAYWEHTPGKKSQRELELEERRKREAEWREADRIDISINTSGKTKDPAWEQMTLVSNIIARKSRETGDKVPFREVITEAKEKGISEERVLELISKLKKAGEIYEPTKDYLRPA